jgi:predicted enzyme involved in methoxymalonyl-ACP biosynthesis
VANRTDKATNLRIIAEKLKIDLDRVVFLDNDPSERDLIRRELPIVSVPELPEDPALFAQTIADAGYFEVAGLNEEDNWTRTRHQAGFAAELAKTEVSELDGYLRGMRLKLH